MKLASIREHRQVLAGNPSLREGFWQIWKENEHFLLALCRHWTAGNEGEARDLLGAAMLHSFEKVGRLQKDVGNPRAWLATVVRHFCIDQHRKKSRNPEYSSGHERMLQIIDNQIGQFAPSVEGDWIKHERYDQLLWQMNGLPARLRDPLILRACQNMSYKEIATHLQISSENARKRVETARKWLQSGKAQNGPETVQDEQVAAEQVLKTASRLVQGRFQHAHPVAFRRKDGTELELPLFLSRRPQRLEQKVASLSLYQQKHPGGWKKEVELGTLRWAQGDLEHAKESLRLAWIRQPNSLSTFHSYMLVLSWLGEWEEMALELSQILNLSQESPLFSLATLLLALLKDGVVRPLLEWDSDFRSIWLQRAVAVPKHKAEMQSDWAAQMQRRPMCRVGHLLAIALNENWKAAMPAAAVAARRFPRDPYAQATILLLSSWSGDCGKEFAFDKLAELERGYPGSWLAFSTKLGLLLKENPAESAAALTEFRRNFPAQAQAAMLDITSLDAFWQSWNAGWSMA